jgi:protein-S-isoprenylcysteine O-methyltransferase Ste14
MRNIRLLLLSLLWLAVFLAVMGGVLFASAGRTDLPMFWACIVVLVVPSLIAVAVIYRRNPELLQERMRPGGSDQDKLSLPVLLAFFPVHWVIAGLDVGRYHWSGSVPIIVQIVGLIGYGCGIILSAWATLVNRFFSSAVRIQTERAQEVITTGPYHFVRHPGYTGGLLFLVCGGIALGSWWSALPALLPAAMIVRRTVMEDRMLQDHLKGYVDYAQRVRYRLIPGLW